MNTIHDENKIKELENNDLSWTDNMRQYAEYIREKTIDECIACVPNKEKEKDISEYEDYEDFVLSVCYKVFNTCREQTITNLNQLKNNG